MENLIDFKDIQYIKHESLGKGSYGEVFKVEDKETKIIYACKNI